MRYREIDISAVQLGHLTPEGRIALKRLIIARAHAERSRILREMLAGFAGLLRRLGATVLRWIAARRLRHAQYVAAAELRSLSDRELKDMGICRCEINALAFAGRA